MDPQHGETIKQVGVLAALVAMVGGWFVGMFRTFATKNEMAACQKAQCARLDVVEREQSLLSMTIRDDVRGIHEKIDANAASQSDQYREIMGLLLKIKGK